VIKEYFANYFLHMADVTFNMEDNTMDVHNKHAEPWKVTLIDTGSSTMTGGRIKRIAPYVDGETFMVTYGDGVADVDIAKLLQFHNEHGRIGTMTSVQPTGRFGAVNMKDDGTISSFQEKPKGDGAWINGGFFVFSSRVFDYIEGDATVFEKEPLENLAKDEQLKAFKHDGYWQPMDTLREKREMEKRWEDGNAPWKVWND
jgi:glucose-1-phosphate cytidylyltransferase